MRARTVIAGVIAALALALVPTVVFADDDDDSYALPERVEICALTKWWTKPAPEDAEYRLRSVLPGAVRWYDRIGAGRPGEPVPNREGFTFSDTCEQIPDRPNSATDGGNLDFEDELSLPGVGTTISSVQTDLGDGVAPCDFGTDDEIEVTVLNGDVVDSDQLPAEYFRLNDTVLPTVEEIGNCLFRINILDSADGVNDIVADLDGPGTTYTTFTELPFCSEVVGPTPGSSPTNLELWCVEEVEWTSNNDEGTVGIDLTILGFNDPRTAW